MVCSEYVSVTHTNTAVISCTFDYVMPPVVLHLTSCLPDGPCLVMVSFFKLQLPLGRATRPDGWKDCLRLRVVERESDAGRQGKGERGVPAEFQAADARFRHALTNQLIGSDLIGALLCWPSASLCARTRERERVCDRCPLRTT